MAKTQLLSEDEKAEARMQTMVRVFRKADRVLSGQKNLDCVIVNFPGAPAAWSDGQTIYFNSATIGNVTSIKEIVQLTGVNYHELSHILFTPRSNSSIRQEILHNSLGEAFNLLEDQRIENFMTGQYPSTEPYFVSMFMRFCTAVQDEWDTAYLLAHGRRYLPTEIRDEFRSRFVAPSLLPQLDSIIDEYRSMTFPRDEKRMLELIWEMNNLLNSKQLEPPKDPNGHKTDGSYNSQRKTTETKGRPQPQRKQDEAQEAAEERDEQCEEERQEEEPGEPQKGTQSGSEPDEESDSKGEGKGGSENNWSDIKEDEGDDSDSGDSSGEDSSEEDDDSDDDGDAAGASGSDGESEESEGEESDGAAGADDTSDDDEGDDSGSDADGDGGRGSAPSVDDVLDELDDFDDEYGDDDDASGDQPGNKGLSGQDQASDRDSGEMDAPGDPGNIPGAGAGTGGGAHVPPPKMSVEELLDEMMEQAEAAEADPDVQQDAEVKRATITKGDGESYNSLPQLKYTLDDPPTEVMLAMKKLSKEFSMLEHDLDPGWDTHRSTGRLNVQRAMTGGSIDEMFDEWREGHNYSTDIELIILADISSSMMDMMKEVSESLWAIKSSAEKVGATVTVYPYDDEAYTLYRRGEKSTNKIRYIKDDGGTNPQDAINQARRDFHGSRRKNKILLIITDGDWMDWGACDPMLRQLEGAGIVTALAYLDEPGLTIEDYRKAWSRTMPSEQVAGLVKGMTDSKSHMCQVFRTITKPADLILFGRELVKQTMKASK